MQPIDIIAVPYDSAQLHYRMGAGPAALLDAGLAQLPGVRVPTIDVDAPSSPDAVRILDHPIRLADAVSRAAAQARAQARFPLVLSGNCFMSVGAVAAISDDLAFVWLDAHGDLNTPANSPSGFLDGMGAAVMLGWCHGGAAATIHDFAPLPASRFTLAGARDLDAGEAAAVASGQVRHVPAAALRDGVSDATLDDMIAGASRAYVHLDLDVLDPDAVGPANTYATRGGVTLEQVGDLITALAHRMPIAGMTISSYDPAVDASGAVRNGAVRLVRGVAQLAPKAV